MIAARRSFASRNVAYHNPADTVSDMGRLLTLVLTLLLATCSFAVEVSVDLARKHQSIDGFGTCLAWWKEKPYDDPAFREMYWRDLGCSMLRMELHPNALTSNGKLDGPAIVLGEDIDRNIALLDFKAKGVRNFGEFARAGSKLKLDQMKLIGSLWTPPHWMKSGATINPRDGQSGGGSLKMDADNLQQFARYVAAYVKGFEQTYGVPIAALSIQNELRFKQNFNSCVYTPHDYSTAVAAVAAEFQRCGIKTQLIGPEDVGVGEPGNLSFLNNQMRFIDALRAEPAAWNALRAFAIHGYAGDGASALGDTGNNWETYWNRIKDDKKPSWQTETSGQNHNWRKAGKNGDRGALSIALSLNDALTRGNVSAWLYWQTAMDTQGKPNPESLTAGADPTAKKYVAAKHFFRLIRPGAVRVEAVEDAPSLHVSAYWHEAGQTLTIQLINMGEEAVTCSLTLKNAPKFTEFSGVRSSETESFEPIGKITPEPTIDLTLPASSIVTLTGRAVKNAVP